MAKHEKTPTGSIAPFGLRLQPELKEKLEELARRNNRSLNSEIAARLEESLDPTTSILVEEQQKTLEIQRRALNSHEDALRAQQSAIETQSATLKQLNDDLRSWRAAYGELHIAIEEAATGNPDNLNGIVERYADYFSGPRESRLPTRQELLQKKDAARRRAKGEIEDE